MKALQIALWFFSGLCVGIAGTSAWQLWREPPATLDTPEAIVEHLRAKGLDYEGKWLGGSDGAAHHGYHVKHKSDSRSWEDLGQANAQYTKNHVVFVPLGNRNAPLFNPIYGDYYLIGDKDEIERILSHFR